MAGPASSAATRSPGPGPPCGAASAPPASPPAGRRPWLPCRASAAHRWPRLGGSRLAMGLLLACGTEHRRVRASGDNLAVVRYCAAQGRLRRPAMQAVVEPGLAALSRGGWDVAWQAVRRRLNVAADAAATEAVQWAGRLREGGATEPRVRVRWARGPPCGHDAPTE